MELFCQIGFSGQQIIPGKGIVFPQHIAVAAVLLGNGCGAGIHIGIGIAQTKTLAKLANHFAKQNRSTTHGVFCALKDPMRQKILLNNPIGEIWGIGKALEDNAFIKNATIIWDASTNTMNFS